MHKICSNRTEVLNSFPESEVENFPANKDFNFWRIQFLADNLWKLWYKHYTNNLQCRQKWISKAKPLKEGDLVLLKDKNAPRRLWHTGMITKTSDDGLPITVFVKSKNSVYERPISGVVLLPRSKY